MTGYEIRQGDALAVLRAMSDESVHCVVTSPPYWGLRDYGMPGQLGLESSPWEYLDRMTELFREVRRVLRKDGTAWVNMGDCYAQGGNGGHAKPHAGAIFHGHAKRKGDMAGRKKVATGGLKPKDLVGMPWRLAFALQADGWYLRQDIVWSKPNPMPESVADRCTKAHEYLFLLSKSPRYYYDAEAIMEPVSGTAHARGDGVNPKASWKTPDGWDTTRGNGGHGSFHKDGREDGHTGYVPKTPASYKGSIPGRKDGPGQDRRSENDRQPRSKQNASFSAAVNKLVDMRNKRSVWEICPEPYPEAHFATFPTELVKPCILAGCPEGGIVLDPFAGSGTTLLVARELGCYGLGIELNPEYIEMAHRRLAQAVLFSSYPASDTSRTAGTPTAAAEQLTLPGSAHTEQASEA